MDWNDLYKSTVVDVDLTGMRKELHEALLRHGLGEALCLQRRMGLDTFTTMRRLGLDESGMAPRETQDGYRSILEGRRIVDREFLDGVVSTGKLPALVSCGTPGEVGRLYGIFLEIMCGNDLDRLGFEDIENVAMPLRDALGPLDSMAVQLVVQHCAPLNSGGAGSVLLLNALARGRSQKDRALIMGAVRQSQLEEEDFGDGSHSCNDDDDDDDGNVDDDDQGEAGDNASPPSKPLDLGWQCAHCHLFKDRKLYSRNQKRRPLGERRCFECTEARSSPVFPCFNCHRILQKVYYSTTQWRKGRMRCCQSCVGGYFCPAFLSPGGCKVGVNCALVHSLQPEETGEVGGVFSELGDGLG